ncbi:MAG: hypothetical protein ACRYGK_08445 [Janthinobacterium lividum]
MQLNLHHIAPASWLKAFDVAAETLECKEIQVNLDREIGDRFSDLVLPGLKLLEDKRGKDCRISLSLGESTSMDDALAMLAYLRSTSQCKALTIGFKPAVPSAIYTLLTGLPQTHVEKLSLNFSMPDALQELLIPALRNPHLEELVLSSAGLDDFGAALLAAVLAHNSGLKSLALIHNRIGTAGTLNLACAIAAHPGLQRFSYTQRKLDQTAWCALGDALARARGIQDIAISEVEMKDDSLTAFLENVCTRTNLAHLNISGSPVSQDSWPLLGRLVSNNHGLRRLNIFAMEECEALTAFTKVLENAAAPLTVRYNPIEDKVKAVFQQAARHNPLLHVEPN